MDRLSVLQDRAGEIPATIVYQDDRVVAFKDINPQAPLHVLVVPRRHIASLNELTPGDDALVGEMVRRAAAHRREHGYADRGYPHGVQQQRRSRPDRVPHPPARARRP